MRTHRDRTIVAFHEIADRTAAETLKGAEVVIDASRARALEDTEYWDHDLVGCAVVAEDGTAVGEVTDVLHAGANDVLVVRGPDGRERLIPFIAEVVRDVIVRERITISLMPGLLD